MGNNQRAEVIRFMNTISNILKVGLFSVAIFFVSEAVMAAGLPKKEANQVIQLSVQTVDKRPVLSKVSLSNDGRLMVTAGDDHYLRIWDAQNGDLKQEFKAHDDWVRGAVFNPTGDQIVSIGQDGQIKVWNLAQISTPTIVREKVRGGRSVEFSPDGTKFAVSGFDPVVYCFDMSTKQLLYRLDAPSPSITAIKFSPDATLLAAGGRNGKVRVWNVSNGTKVADMNGDSRRVNALAFSPDAQQLALGTTGSRIMIFNPRTGRMVSQLPERYGKTYSLQYCGMTVLASGESDNTIRLWDLTGNREMTHLIGHTGTVSTMFYDEQFNRLVTGSFDTTIRHWAMMQ